MTVAWVAGGDEQGGASVSELVTAKITAAKITAAKITAAKITAPAEEGEQGRSFTHGTTHPLADRAGRAVDPDGADPSGETRVESAGDTALPSPLRLADEEVLARLQAIPRIGRFTILRPIGEGGMGTVSLAYDDELDRRIAIKMLRGRFAKDRGLRQRFHREAKALAQLAHPNVVTIYEVGEHLGRPYLAMELVEGADLRSWLRSAKRPRATIISHFLAAGRGLAAAHSRGIVHRDFKPSNVLVGDDGRVRVVDFGLAKSAVSSEDDVAVEGAFVDGPGSPLTVVGSVLGTPAYMSPEQLVGGDVDSRSDQFSFGVALYEALLGHRPFAGRTLAERREEAARNPEVELRQLPPWLRRILRRALAPVAEDRYPSMEALLDDLSADPRRWWRRSALAVTLVGGIAAVGYAAAPADPCTDAGTKIADTWPRRSGDLRRALVDAGDNQAQQLIDTFTEYADAWARTDRAACIAHHHGESSGAEWDDRVRCLAAARSSLAVLIDALISSRGEELDAALSAANRLPSLDACMTSVGALHGPPPPSPEVAETIEALHQELARIDLVRGVTGNSDALGRVTRILERARESGYRPVEAEALHILGQIKASTADYEGAVRDYEASLWIREALDQPVETASVMSSMIFILSDRLGQAQAGDRWRPHVDALIERIGPGSLAEAHFASTYGTIALNRGDVDEALANMRRALAIAEAKAGRESLITAGHLGNLGTALARAKDYEAARAAIRGSLAILEEELGPDHGRVIMLLDNLANTYIALDDHRAALKILRDALERSLRGHGPAHPQTAILRRSVGAALVQLGDYDSARTQLLAALVVQREVLGAHRQVLPTLKGLVQAEVALRDYSSAREHAKELLTVVGTIYPADDPELFEAYATAAEVEYAADRPQLAAALVSTAIDLPRGRVDRESPDLIPYLQFYDVWSMFRAGRRGSAAKLAEDVYVALKTYDADVYEEELVVLDAIRSGRSPPAAVGSKK